MAELQATMEKEETRRKLLLQASHLIVHPKEMFAIFPVMLSLASVCTKILSRSFSEDDNFSDPANQRGPLFSRRKKPQTNNRRIVQHGFSFGNGRTPNK